MVITVGGVKGGTGKTTIATNLAVMRAAAGRNVLLIDADEQASASQFSDRRNERPDLESRASFTLVRLADNAVRTEGLKLARIYDDVIIDTPGRDTRSQRAALSICDKLLVPLRPRAYDVWSVDKSIGVVNDMLATNETMQVCCFINQGDTRGNDNADTTELLRHELAIPNFSVLEAEVRNRKAWANSANEGLGVAEWKLDRKATEEMQRLYDLVFDVAVMPN